MVPFIGGSKAIPNGPVKTGPYDNKGSAMDVFHRKSVTGRVREKAMTDPPRANWLRALPARAALG